MERNAHRPRLSTALTHDEALAELNANSGAQFDPSIAETLITIVYGAQQPRSDRALSVLDAATAEHVGQLLVRSVQLDVDKL